MKKILQLRQKFIVFDLNPQKKNEMRPFFLIKSDIIYCKHFDNELG